MKNEGDLENSSKFATKKITVVVTWIENMLKSLF